MEGELKQESSTDYTTKIKGFVDEISSHIFDNFMIEDQLKIVDHIKSNIINKHQLLIDKAVDELEIAKKKMDILLGEK